MLRRLFSALSAPPAAEIAYGAIPDGQRVYAVGDIHGRLDLLDDLLSRIDADDAARPMAETSLIFLGDLVDRGPCSAQVVERLLALSRSARRVRFLMGNHEEVFLRALSGDRHALPFFLRIGGKPTLLSYGIDEETYRKADYPQLHAWMTAHVPPDHVAFLESFEDMIVVGDYAFVHAGIQPRLPLAEQSAAALRWVREEFLSHPHPFEKIVVHGHTIVDDVEETGNRIGLDTGAYASGRLTAMGFERDARWTLQTG
jgi:serine/threonine protein phosphatase 1